jgi:hypothetical protein
MSDYSNPQAKWFEEGIQQVKDGILHFVSPLYNKEEQKPEAAPIAPEVVSATISQFPLG